MQSTGARSASNMGDLPLKRSAASSDLCFVGVPGFRSSAWHYGLEQPCQPFLPQKWKCKDKGRSHKLCTIGSKATSGTFLGMEQLSF